MRPLLLTSHTVEGFARGHPPIEPVCRTIWLIFRTFLVTDAIEGRPEPGIPRRKAVTSRPNSNMHSISRAVRDSRITPLVAGPPIGACPAPPGEQTVGDLFRREREDEMVAPGPVDVQISRAQALPAESEFLHDPAARPVL